VSRLALSVTHTLQQTTHSFAKLDTDVENIRQLIKSLHTDDDKPNFIFAGPSLAALDEPLTLMKADIQKTIQAAARSNFCEHLVISESDAYWLGDEMRSLLAYTYEAAAKHMRSKISTSHNQ
jgi:hypothetical protein